jgi:hypothetical protein
MDPGSEVHCAHGAVYREPLPLSSTLHTARFSGMQLKAPRSLLNLKCKGSMLR